MWSSRQWWGERPWRAVVRARTRSTLRLALIRFIIVGSHPAGPQPEGCEMTPSRKVAVEIRQGSIVFGDRPAFLPLWIRGCRGRGAACRRAVLGVHDAHDGVRVKFGDAVFRSGKSTLLRGVNARIRWSGRTRVNDGMDDLEATSGRRIGQAASVAQRHGLQQLACCLAPVREKLGRG